MDFHKIKMCDHLVEKRGEINRNSRKLKNKEIGDQKVLNLDLP